MSRERVSEQIEQYCFACTSLSSDPFLTIHHLVILDGPGNRRIESLETIQNAPLRIATGALRTSPVRALQVDANMVPLNVRRRDLLMRYFLKVKADARHPCHSIMDIDVHDQLYRNLSESCMRRISGFPLSYRLRQIITDLDYVPPEDITKVEGTIAP